ncbi:MAG: gliding motility protein GldN [Prevotellaceae bacterium]|nr:gliding motility protein GldN [Prevotellaceae bacterium]
MKRLILISIVALLSLAAQAQPTKRRTTTSSAVAQAGNPKAKQTVDRASLLFPTGDEMPSDVVWKRDIYRQLDLDLDKNAPLYYPVEPIGTQCNLFTFIFRLFLTGRVAAYNYKLDGNESFDDKDKITDVKELLDRYYIYYEEEDGKLTVADNDVPSAYVKRYYIKESSYLDQRTGTYNTKVTALCPIMLESDDFGDSASPKPLFWMKYDDLAPYLSRLPVMASNYNNVTNMTADDYFQMNHYEGKIYKTSNLQGQVLADYCKTEEAMTEEQKKIEQQLTDFEQHIWSTQVAADSLDSVAVDEQSAKQKRKKASASTDDASSKSSSLSSTRRSSGSSSGSRKSKSSSSSKSSAVTASARRTRR